jgi:hypothetical protein
MMLSPIEKSTVAAVPAHSDREWFVPLMFIVLIETLLWFAAYRAGAADHPIIATYGSIALTFFILTLSWKGVRLLIRERPTDPVHRLFDAAVENRERIVMAALGSVVLSVGSAAFGSLKAGIPRVIPFWFDRPESIFEDWLFGGSPAILIDPKIPWILPYLDRIYATFIPTIIIAMLALLASKPSREKSRALVAIALGWLVNGVFCAYAFSSVGPIFYDQTYGGRKFAALTELIAHNAQLTTIAANHLWIDHMSRNLSFGDGISAFPSMHVTMTTWLALVLSRTRYAPLGWAYLFIIWVSSILLGWHWVLCGIAGGLGMIGLWKLAPKLLYVQRSIPVAEAVAAVA